MNRLRFSRGQWLILILMFTAVVLIFSLLAFSVVTTLQQFPSPPSPLSTPPPSSLSPLVTPTVPVITPTLPPTPTAPPSATLSPLQSARAVHEIGRIVASVRDLAPVEQIPVTFPTEHEIALFLLQRYQTEQPQKALALPITLGLIPPSDPLPLPDVADQATYISSMYLATGQQILLVAGHGPSPEVEQAMAHALAHALQDRAFDLDSLLPCQSTTDAEMALQGLIEGDTVFTTIRYAEMELGSEIADRLLQQIARSEQPTYAPLAGNPAMERLALLYYNEGSQLVSTIYKDGGWEAVNRAYAHPPCSTEQLLHPERYLSGEPVQTVAQPDLSPVLDETWEPVKRDTLGEFFIGLHLAHYLDNDQTAWEAAQGWAGDTFTVWENDQEQLIVWRVAWDDRDEAAAFEQAYAMLIPRFRIPSLVSTETMENLSGQFWEGTAGAAYLARAGRVVTVVWGPDIETVSSVAAILP